MQLKINFNCLVHLAAFQVMICSLLSSLPLQVGQKKCIYFLNLWFVVIHSFLWSLCGCDPIRLKRPTFFVIHAHFNNLIENICWAQHIPFYHILWGKHWKNTFGTMLHISANIPIAVQWPVTVHIILQYISSLHNPPGTKWHKHKPDFCTSSKDVVGSDCINIIWQEFQTKHTFQFVRIELHNFMLWSYSKIACWIQ